jgi:hypothetical protein
MPGDPGELVVTNACAYYTSRTRLRVQRAPGIPRSLWGSAHALCWAEDFRHNSGESRREIEEACQRHCEERMRRSNSFFSLCGQMDCFAYARNDGSLMLLCKNILRTTA